MFAAFVIVGADNAVNLTDGIDGLAASVTLPVAIFFVFVGFRRGDMGVVIFSAALAGALLGFLRYNFNPAKVFMGDTGSLFLGGAVAGLAFACEMPLILLLVGLIYIIETLSVILQVTYFKATHGKRLFKICLLYTSTQPSNAHAYPRADCAVCTDRFRAGRRAAAVYAGIQSRFLCALKYGWVIFQIPEILKNRRIERYRIIVQDVENNVSKAESLLIKGIHYDD